MEVSSNTIIGLEKCLVRLSGAAARTGSYQGKERNKNINKESDSIPTKKGGKVHAQIRRREYAIMETL